MQIFNSFNSEVIALLKQGAVGVIPTDTLYGVVTPLFLEHSVNRIYDVKGHNEQRPVGTVLINDPMQVSHIVADAELQRALKYWPAPTSVVLTVSGPLHYAHRGYYSLPFRIPDHKGLRDLVKQTGPLATSSVNHSGKPPAETIQEAMAYFRESVDFYVDGGNLSGRQASKIIAFDNAGNEQLLR